MKVLTVSILSTFSEFEAKILTVKHRQARQAASQDSGSDRESLSLLSHLHVAGQAVH